MNNYPSWWDQTVTVYNRYEDPTTHAVTWFKNTISGCFWKHSEDKVLIGSTKVESCQTVCRVRKSDKFMRRYLWEQLSAAEKSNFFTFGPDDIIVLGEVSDTIDEYTSGRRSSDLLTKYKKLQGCMVVEFCAENVGGGRGNEHYRVSGV